MVFSSDSDVCCNATMRDATPNSGEIVLKVGGETLEKILRTLVGFVTNID